MVHDTHPKSKGLIAVGKQVAAAEGIENIPNIQVKAKGQLAHFALVHSVKHFRYCDTPKRGSALSTFSSSATLEPTEQLNQLKY